MNETLTLEKVLEGIDAYLTEKESKEQKKEKEQRKFIQRQSKIEYDKHRKNLSPEERYDMFRKIDKKFKASGGHDDLDRYFDEDLSPKDRKKAMKDYSTKFKQASKETEEENRRKADNEFQYNAYNSQYALSNAVKKPRLKDRIRNGVAGFTSNRRDAVVKNSAEDYTIDDMKLRIYEAYEEGTITAEDKYMMLEYLNPENYEDNTAESFVEFMNH